MQSASRRDPKKFAQRTLAAAVAASALATSGVAAVAQTTGGGIGAAVDTNVPTSPANPGSGPGINTTGSPVIGVPENLKQPIGGNSGPRGPNGTSRLPGSTPPPPKTVPPGVGRNQSGSTATPGRVTPPMNPTRTNRGTSTAPGNTGTPAGDSVTPRPVNTSSNLRSGQITNVNGNSFTFQEGAVATTLNLTPRTVIQMNGRPIALSDIPANASVQIERTPTNANQVQRVLVTPQATTLNGTGAGAANTPGNDLNAATANGSVRGNDINSPTPNGSLRNNDINAPTPNGSLPGNDINAPTVNNSAGTSGALSDRPLAPGQNPNDAPLAPFTRGPDRRFQPGFDESANPPNANTQNGQTPAARTDSTQFLGPSSANNPATANPLPNRTDIPDRSREGGVDNNANRQVTVPANPGPQGRPEPRPADRRWQDSMNERLGMGLSASKDGVVVGDVTRESLAGRSGFITGDRIESLNGRSVSTPADLAQALRSSGQQGRFTARITREGVPRDVNLSLPQGFFNTAGITGAAADNVGVGPAVGLGGGLAVTPDGNVGVGVPVAPGVGVVVPVEGSGAVGTTAQQGSVGTPARGAASANSVQNTATAESRPTPRDGAPIGTSRSPGSLTTEALKVPDVDLGWRLKPTSEGVQVTELVGGGIASRSKLEAGDIIDSIDNRPVTSPGAVSYELHRHRGGTSVDLTILRDGKRRTQWVRLPEDHQPLLLNTSESFGKANNTAKEQGATQADPAPVSPTEQSLKKLEEENRALKAEIERLKNQEP